MLVDSELIEADLRAHVGTFMSVRCGRPLFRTNKKFVNAHKFLNRNDKEKHTMTLLHPYAGHHCPPEFGKGGMVEGKYV